MRHWLSLLVALTVGVSVGAEAKKPPPVALVIVSKGKVSRKVIKTLQRELKKRGPRVGSGNVIEGKRLKRKLKKKPEVAVARCGSDLGCIAKLGKKARVAQVVYGRASPGDGSTVTVKFIAVGVLSSEVERTIEIEIASAREVKKVVALQVFEILGVTDPGFVLVKGTTGDVRIDGEIIGSGPGPHEVPPGVREVEAPGLSPTSVTVLPGKTKKLKAKPEEMTDEPELALEDFIELDADPVESEEVPLAPPPPDLDFAAATPDDVTPAVDDDFGFDPPDADADSGADSEPLGELTAAVPVTQPDPDDGGLGLLGYSGIGVAGLGAVSAGVGGYFGIQAESKRSSIEYGPGGTPQAEAKTLQEDANMAASRATILFIAGGGAAAVGAALLAIDLLSSGSSGSSVALTPVPGGIGLAARW